jgi:hypothetical protein
MASYEIYSKHGLVLDRKGTLDEAYSCFKDWPQAEFVISGGKIIFHREDVVDREVEQRRLPCHAI